MRAAVMYDVDDIRIEERPLPALEPGDVLVRTAASGVCSGDLMPWYVRKKAPFVFGHEPSGTVVACAGEPVAAADGRRLAPGDRVFAHHHAPCLRCEECRAERFVHCSTWRATALDPGAMAEFFRVPGANLADTRLLPDELTFVDGSLIEPLGCVVKSLRRAFAFDGAFGSQPSGGRTGAPADAPERSARANIFAPGCFAGRTLYVIGAGVMGLMHVAVAAAFGATVFASDFHPARRALAERLGASIAFEPAAAEGALQRATDGKLAHVVVCGPGSSAALAHAVGCVGPDGTVLMFTPIEPGERFSFDQSAAYFRDVRLVSSYSCGPQDTAEAVRLLAGQVVTAARLAATEFPFPGVAHAYEEMRSARIVKAVVTFSPSAAS